MDEKGLQALKAKFAGIHQEDQARAKTEIPFIREGTLLQIADELHLVFDPKADQLARSISGDPDWNGFYLGKRMSEAEFKVFPPSGEGFLQQMNVWLKDTYAQAAQYQIAATVGMAYVFRSYHIQEGATLVDGLKSIGDGQIMSAFKDSTSNLSGQEGIVKRLMSGKRLPDHQVYLRRGLEALKVPTPGESQLEEGAVAMYTALSRMWPAIVDPSQRTQPKWY